jgi:hypothetical protein
MLQILPVRKPRSPRLQTLVKEGSAKVVVLHPLCRKRAQPLQAQKIGWMRRMGEMVTRSPREELLLALLTARTKRGSRKPLQDPLEPVSALGKR